MARGTTIRVEIDGIDETLAALQRVGPEADRAIRERSLELSRLLAVSMTAAGKAEGSQAGIVADTVRANRGRTPEVVAGGPTRIGRRRAPAGALVMGSEFGSNFYRQFRPHVGKASLWFYRAAQHEAPLIAREWDRAADDVLRAFSR